MLQSFAVLHPVFWIDFDSQPQWVGLGEPRTDKRLNESLATEPGVGIWPRAIEHLVKPDRLLPSTQTQSDAQPVPAWRHRNHPAAAHIEISLSGSRQRRGNFGRHSVPVNIEVSRDMAKETPPLVIRQPVPQALPLRPQAVENVRPVVSVPGR